MDKPTLVITGTDDNFYQPHVNSLKIAEKIPGAWLVQRRETQTEWGTQRVWNTGEFLHNSLEK